MFQFPFVPPLVIGNVDSRGQLECINTNWKGASVSHHEHAPLRVCGFPSMPLGSRTAIHGAQRAGDCDQHKLHHRATRVVVVVGGGAAGGGNKGSV